MTEPKRTSSGVQVDGAGQEGIARHELERRRGDLEPDEDRTAAGVVYQDGRGSQRYVGGGARGGQNWANEGYGGGQSYSAGEGYAAEGESPQVDEHAAPPEVAVSPEDLDVKDYELQGGYGRPPDSKTD